MDGESYIIEFGVPEEEEDGNKAVLAIRLTEAKIAALKQAAGEKGISISDYIDQSLAF